MLGGVISGEGHHGVESNARFRAAALVGFVHAWIVGKFKIGHQQVGVSGFGAVHCWVGGSQNLCLIKNWTSRSSECDQRKGNY